MEQTRERTITAMWEKYRDMVVLPEDSATVERYRQAFWAGAASVLDILVRLQGLDEGEQSETVAHVFAELDGFRDEVTANAREIIEKHFGRAS